MYHFCSIASVNPIFLGGMQDTLVLLHVAWSGDRRNGLRVLGI